MNILLFGVSNVGKSTVGETLAKRLGYVFFDLDELVKEKLGITLEDFISTGTLFERDQIRCRIILELISTGDNKVVAITPLSYMQDIVPLLSGKDVMAIELTDSAMQIFDRLVFSDENDIIYRDDEYKNKHAEHYLSEIQEDLDWYGSVYKVLKFHFDMNGRDPEETADALINTFHLTKEM